MTTRHLLLTLLACVATMPALAATFHPDGRCKDGCNYFEGDGAHIGAVEKYHLGPARAKLADGRVLRVNILAVAEAILKRAPFVDLVFGPQTLHRLPDLLRAKGAVCVEAPGTEDALREFEGQAYEAALIDIQMPGADGYELARRFKARHPKSETRLIAMSAFGLAQEHSGLFDAYVAKPAKADTMVGTIVRALERRGSAASSSN